jgi:hypothetical protein
VAEPEVAELDCPVAEVELLGHHQCPVGRGDDDLVEFGREVLVGAGLEVPPFDLAVLGEHPRGPLVTPDLGRREHRVAEALVVVPVRVGHQPRQPGDLPDRLGEFPALGV